MKQNITDNQTRIKQLPKQFIGRGEVRGFDFSLVSRSNWGFCYEVRIDGTITHYEVFLLKINKRFGCVSYPGSGSFGNWAWTYQTKEEAIKKLSEL